MKVNTNVKVCLQCYKNAKVGLECYKDVKWFLSFDSVILTSKITYLFYVSSEPCNPKKILHILFH